MKRTLQAALYKFDSQYTVENLKDSIIAEGYESQALINAEINGFKLSLFYKRTPATPKWKGFIGDIAKPEQSILLPGRSSHESFILLLQNTSNDSIYGVTGGFGYAVIQNYIDNEFGVNIFARIIEKEDKILKATREKSIVGGVLGTAKHFRKNYNLYENEDFGKIYQELQASLNKDILTGKLGFTADDIKNDSICIAKSSFKITKKLNFNQLITIIKGCESIMDTEEPIIINDVIKLTKKKDKTLIFILEEELITQLWNRYQNPLSGYPFDLCANDFEGYLTASEYEVRKGNSDNNFFGNYTFEEERLNDVDVLFSKLKESDKKPTNKEAFAKLIRDFKIFSFDENGEQLTHGSFFEHLLGDVTLTGDEQKYFLIDKSWYKIKNEFIERLNQYCHNFINGNYHNRLKKAWNHTTETENQYNSKYIGEENTIVLDKITPENLEPCDVMYWDNENLYLCHVKAEFGNTMRDLCSQITIAANRIQRDVSGNKEFIKKIYQSLKDKIGQSDYFDRVGRQTERYTEEEFVNLFITKRITFVLGVLDTGSSNRTIKEIKKFRSSIAKYSLQVLSQDMKKIDMPLEITQIQKEVAESEVVAA